MSSLEEAKDDEAQGQTKAQSDAADAEMLRLEHERRAEWGRRLARQRQRDAEALPAAVLLLGRLAERPDIIEALGGADALRLKALREHVAVGRVSDFALGLVTNAVRHLLDPVVDVGIDESCQPMRDLSDAIQRCAAYPAQSADLADDIARAKRSMAKAKRDPAWLEPVTQWAKTLVFRLNQRLERAGIDLETGKPIPRPMVFTAIATNHPQPPPPNPDHPAAPDREPVVMPGWEDFDAMPEGSP